MSESGSNKTKRGIFNLKQSLKVALILLLPALLLNFFISGYLKDKNKLKQISDISQARLEMARLQRLLDLKTVINQAINKQKKYAQGLIDKNLSNRSILNRFSTSFHRVFPANTKLIWFKQNFKIIDSPEQSRIRKKNRLAKICKNTYQARASLRIEQKNCQWLDKNHYERFSFDLFF